MSYTGVMEFILIITLSTDVFVCQCFIVPNLFVCIIHNMFQTSTMVPLNIFGYVTNLLNCKRRGKFVDVHNLLVNCFKNAGPRSCFVLALELCYLRMCHSVLDSNSNSKIQLGYNELWNFIFSSNKRICNHVSQFYLYFIKKTVLYLWMYLQQGQHILTCKNTVQNGDSKNSNKKKYIS